MAIAFNAWLKLRLCSLGTLSCQACSWYWPSIPRCAVSVGGKRRWFFDNHHSLFATTNLWFLIVFSKTSRDTYKVIGHYTFVSDNYAACFWKTFVFNSISTDFFVHNNDVFFTGRYISWSSPWRAHWIQCSWNICHTKEYNRDGMLRRKYVEWLQTLMLNKYNCIFVFCFIPMQCKFRYVGYF